MRVTTRLRLGLIALREGLRVLALPFHLGVFGLRRRNLVRRMEQLLGKERGTGGQESAGKRFREGAGLGAPPKRILIACGEASGEDHALRLVKTLRSAFPDLQIDALGGSRLEEQGIRVHVNLVDQAVMGIKGVLRQLPFFFRAMGSCLEFLDRDPPDLFIPIDNPGFNLLLAEQCKKRGIPVLYYICPQYWAWGPWRMRRFCNAVDGAISILPFEPPLFESLGVPTACAGHPLLRDLPKPLPDEARKPCLALLPGSRSKEIQRNLPGMLRVWEAFREEHPEADCKILQENPRRERELKGLLDTTPNPPRLVYGDTMEELSRARLALVKSGTGSLQASLLGTPSVVVYKLGNRLEEWLGRKLLTVPWIAATNLVMGSRLVPEYCFAGEDGWEEVQRSLLGLWVDGPARKELLSGLALCRRALEGPGADHLVLSWIQPGDLPG